MTTPASHSGYDAEIVARAEALVPLLAEHAAHADETGSLAPEVVEALDAAGLFSLGVPKRYGGLQTTMRTQLEVSAALGRGCSAAAWVVQNINASAVFVGKFSEQAQDDVWGANPRARACGSQTPSLRAERVEGGWRITGRWAYLSGVEQADWAFLNFMVEGPAGPPLPHFAVVPIAEGEVVQTWDMVGMRATASNTLVLDDHFVPEHRVFEFLPSMFEARDATPFTDETLYRTPIVSMLTLILAGSPIGMAEAVLEQVRALAPKRGVTYSLFSTQAEWGGFHADLARGALLIESGRRSVMAAADRLDQAAADDGRFAPEDRAWLRAQLGFAMAQLREGVQVLLDAHGTSAFATKSDLQRRWRDLNTATRHGMLVPTLGYEAYGRQLLGLTEPILQVL